MPTPFPFVSGAVLTAANLNSITELPTRTLTGSGAAVAADAYSRVILNGTSITYTINTSTFSAGQVVEIYNANSTTATIAAGAGITLNGAAGLTLVQYQAAQLYAVSATSFILFKGSSEAVLVVRPETTFTAATSFTADNVFISGYNNYRVVMRYETSGSNNINVQLRVSGTNASTNYNVQLISGSDTTLTGFRSTARGDFPVGSGTSGAFVSTLIMDLTSPNIAAPTLMVSNASRSTGGYTSPVVHVYNGNHSTATAYTGLSFAVGGGENATGTYTIYGYKA